MLPSSAFQRQQLIRSRKNSSSGALQRLELGRDLSDKLTLIKPSTGFSWRKSRFLLLWCSKDRVLHATQSSQIKCLCRSNLNMNPNKHLWNGIKRKVESHKPSNKAETRSSPSLSHISRVFCLQFIEIYIWTQMADLDDRGLKEIYPIWYLISYLILLFILSSLILKIRDKSTFQLLF